MGTTEFSRDWPSKVAVVGAGTMGIGISHVFALGGVPTVLVDETPERSALAVTRSVELIGALEQGGIVGPGSTRRIEELTSAAGSIEAAVTDADLIVEAVVERAEVKLDVYTAIEAATRDSSVIATNTSSIPIELLASRLEAPGRFLGVHWFVPPLLVPCVEVIPSPTTDDRVIRDVMKVLTRLDKSPVVVGDSPGFVANRIQFAMFKEAAKIVEEGLATAEQVDDVVRSSFGFRLPFFGPFTIADMAGLDVYANIFDTLERGFGPDFAAPDILTELVAKGDFGVKTGHGFLDITQDEATELIGKRDRAYLALAKLRRELNQ